MYLALFTPHNLALLEDWLAETGELYVDVYLPHSGADGTPYFIRSLREFKELVAQQTWPEIGISVFRRLQYPVRGVADQALLEQALRQISDGQCYTIVSLNHCYPSRCVFKGRGSTHAELRNDLAEVIGERVGVGQDPFDQYDDAWFLSHPDDVFMLTVSKTHNYHENCARHPDRYELVEKMWRC